MGFNIVQRVRCLGRWKILISGGGTLLSAVSIAMVLLNQDGFLRINLKTLHKLRLENVEFRFQACVAILNLISMFLIFLVIGHYIVEVESWSLATNLPQYLALSPCYCLGFMIEIVINGINPSLMILWQFARAKEFPRMDMDISPYLLFIFLPTFVRIYWLFRFLFNSLPELNSIDARFLSVWMNLKLTFLFHFKYLLLTYTAAALVAWMAYFTLIGSFLMRLCECNHNPSLENCEAYLSDTEHSLYHIMITYMTVGYGDFAPVSGCGKLVSLSWTISAFASIGVISSVVQSELEMKTREQLLHKELEFRQYQLQLRDVAARYIQRRYRLNRIYHMGRNNLTEETLENLEKEEAHWLVLRTRLRALVTKLHKVEFDAEQLLQ